MTAADGASPGGGDDIWDAGGGVPVLAAASITLVEGTSFCVSDEDGEIRPFLPQGLFVRDTRIISGWRTRANGLPIEPLAVEVAGGHRATLIGRIHDPDRSGAAGSVVLERRRTVTSGLTESLTIRNYSRHDTSVLIEMRMEADFADLFDVKSSRRRPASRPRIARAGRGLRFAHGHGAERREVFVHAPGSDISGHRLVYRADVPARGTWATSLHIEPSVLGRRAGAEIADLELGVLEVERIPIEWHARTVTIGVENPVVAHALERGHSDIEALRIADRLSPRRTVIAAGAPWYMALFGRDSLLTSIMALPIDADIALGSLRSLGDRQGRTVDPVTEEQPGRILHEVRSRAAADSAFRGGGTYYGSIDATPLYVVAVGELSRWGLAEADAADLIAHADRCLSWIESFGDRDGDGFVEYERTSPHGLVNQGWKDSWDALQSADGRLARTPIALCEVQGYVYAAYRARARLAAQRGETEAAERYAVKAATLKREFNDRFWLPERQYFAMALDGDKQPVDACASNMGHCLWSGIVDRTKAPFVAERLLAPDMFSGWGIRTLSADMASYDPVSYHNGSVWPHDNAIIVAGLMRYGFTEKAQRVAMGLFEASRFFAGRLPELFCGFSRAEHPRPVPYPNACSPQAWAAVTPFSLVQTLLGLDVDVTARRLRLDPRLPADFGAVRLENLLIGGSRVSIDAAGGDPRVSGLPEGFALQTAELDPVSDPVSDPEL